MHIHIHIYIYTCRPTDRAREHQISITHSHPTSSNHPTTLGQVHEYCKHAVVDLSITMQEAASQVPTEQDKQTWDQNLGNTWGVLMIFRGETSGKLRLMWFSGEFGSKSEHMLGN